MLWEDYSKFTKSISFNSNTSYSTWYTCWTYSDGDYNILKYISGLTIKATNSLADLSATIRYLIEASNDNSKWITLVDKSATRPSKGTGYLESDSTVNCTNEKYKYYRLRFYSTDNNTPTTISGKAYFIKEIDV